MNHGDFIRIIGTNGTDILRGNHSDEIIRGKGGGDTLFGAEGVNILTGGEGVDVFGFRADLESQNTITDFKPGKDRVLIEDAPDPTWDHSWELVFGGRNAGDGEDAVIYNAKNGRLFWDRAGDGDAVLIADIGKKLDIAKGDIGVMIDV